MEQVGLEVTLWSFIPALLSSNLAHDTGYLCWFLHSSPQSLQRNPGIVRRLDWDRFLPDLFQFIVLPWLYHSTMWSFETVTAVKQPTILFHYHIISNGNLTGALEALWNWSSPNRGVISTCALSDWAKLFSLGVKAVGTWRWQLKVQNMWCYIFPPYV
jgi:hypothetical protein